MPSSASSHSHHSRHNVATTLHTVATRGTFYHGLDEIFLSLWRCADIGLILFRASSPSPPATYEWMKIIRRNGKLFDSMKNLRLDYVGNEWIISSNERMNIRSLRFSGNYDWIFWHFSSTNFPVQIRRQKYKSVYNDSTVICCHGMTYAEWLTVDSEIANFMKISTEFIFVDGVRWL